MQEIAISDEMNFKVNYFSIPNLIFVQFGSDEVDLQTLYDDDDERGVKICWKFIKRKKVKCEF